jgi:hypothetical protein
LKVTPRAWPIARACSIARRRSVSAVVEHLDLLALEARPLVGLVGLAVLVPGPVVEAPAGVGHALALEPVRLLLVEPGLLGQREGAVEAAERLVHLPEPQVAQGEVAEVLAHRGLQREALADGQGLLVVLHGLAVAAQEQVNAPDVAQGVPLSAGEVRAPVELERAVVLLQGALVVTQLVVDEAEVVQGRAFELAVAQVAADGDAAVEVLDRLRVLSHLPEDQPQVTEGDALLPALAQALLLGQGAAQVVDGLGEVTEVLVAVADQAQNAGLAPPVLRRPIERKRALEFGEGRLGTLLAVELSRPGENIIPLLPSRGPDGLSHEVKRQGQSEQDAFPQRWPSTLKPRAGDLSVLPSDRWARTQT